MMPRQDRLVRMVSLVVYDGTNAQEILAAMPNQLNIGSTAVLHPAISSERSGVLTISWPGAAVGGGPAPVTLNTGDAFCPSTSEVVPASVVASQFTQAGNTGVK